MARSLWEADVYVALKLAERGAAPGERLQPAPPLELDRNITEGPDAWTYSSPVGEITVPYASERTSEQTGMHFGLGRSRLVDAAQWVIVAHRYADEALEGSMNYDGEPGEARSNIELAWELAAEAINQAMEFLPGDAAEVPDSEIWTEFGAESKAAHPGMLHRAKLEEDLEYFRGALANFRALHGPNFS
ncbi:MAG TPA: hypothetical protein VGL05_36355 [Kribbella sp.]